MNLHKKLSQHGWPRINLRTKVYIEKYTKMKISGRRYNSFWRFDSSSKEH